AVSAVACFDSVFFMWHGAPTVVTAYTHLLIVNVDGDDVSVLYVDGVTIYLSLAFIEICIILMPGIKPEGVISHDKPNSCSCGIRERHPSYICAVTIFLRADVRIVQIIHFRLVAPYKGCCLTVSVIFERATSIPLYLVIFFLDHPIVAEPG